VSSTVPKGWVYEGPDPSVGIFGEEFIHNDCPSMEVGTCDPLTAEASAEIKGEGDRRVLITNLQLVCSQCGTTAVAVREDWIGPEEDQ